jgi:hypothetical protein
VQCAAPIRNSATKAIQTFKASDIPIPATSGIERAQPTVSEDAHALLLNQVSWGAIFAGVVVGLVVQVLLTMLGVGIGVAGALHGLTTWAFTTLLVLYLLSTAVGSIVGGAFSGVATAVGGMGQTIAQAAGPIVAQSNPLDAIESQVRATGTDPEALNAAATNAVRALVSGDEA